MVSECDLEVIFELFPGAAATVDTFMQHLNRVKISAMHGQYYFPLHFAIKTY